MKKVGLFAVLFAVFASLFSACNSPEPRLDKSKYVGRTIEKERFQLRKTAVEMAWKEGLEAKVIMEDGEPVSDGTTETIPGRLNFIVEDNKVVDVEVEGAVLTEERSEGGFWASVFAAFAVGSLLWWLLTAVFVIGLCWSMAAESGFGATVCVIIYVLFLQFICHVNIFGLASTNPLTFISVILSYLAVGVIWSFAKWYFYLSNFVDKYKEARMDWLTNKMRGSAISLFTQVPDELKEEWKEHVKNSYGILERPSVSQNKARIARWITYWPASLIWSVIDDMLKAIVKRIIAVLDSWYQGILRNVYRSVDRDME